MRRVNLTNKNKYLSLLASLALLVGGGAIAATIETVNFPGREGKIEFMGLLKPINVGPHAAVVMLHGRGGPYSSLISGVAAANNLTARHRTWGEFWGTCGYVASHVDSFGPRGHMQDVSRHLYGLRPAAVSEQFVRSLDAYGTLDYLRARKHVIAERIGVQGWANVGMTLLWALGQNTLYVASEMDRVRLARPTPSSDFRAAIAQYPGYMAQLDQADYHPNEQQLPLLEASDNDEVTPTVRSTLADKLNKRCTALGFVLYPDAQHTFDNPGETKQSRVPYKAAMEDPLQRTEIFFMRNLWP